MRYAIKYIVWIIGNIIMFAAMILAVVFAIGILLSILTNSMHSFAMCVLLEAASIGIMLGMEYVLPWSVKE